MYCAFTNGASIWAKTHARASRTAGVVASASAAAESRHIPSSPQQQQQKKTFLLHVLQNSNGDFHSVDDDRTRVLAIPHDLTNVPVPFHIQERLHGLYK